MIHLSNDLILQIFEYLQDDAKTLKNLADAHPSLSWAANQVRDRVRRLVVRGFRAQTDCEELLATLNNTQAAKVRANRDTTNLGGKTLSTQIRYLDLGFSYHNGSTVPPALATILQEEFTPCLREITIYVRDIPESTTTSAWYPANYNDHTPNERSAARDYEYLIDAIENRIRDSRSKKQEIAIRFELDPCDERTLMYLVRPRENMLIKGVKAELSIRNSPFRLVNYLDFAKDTLTDVTILAEYGGWRSDPGAPMQVDFSDFSALLRLQVSAGVWFKHAAVSREPEPCFVWRIKDSRPSVVELLPSTLRALRVDFASSAAVFASGEGYRKHFSLIMKQDNAAVKIRPAYHWILELAGNRHLRDLREVSIMEDMCTQANRVMNWPMPQDLRTQYESAGIKLTVQLREESLKYSHASTMRKE